MRRFAILVLLIVFSTWVNAQACSVTTCTEDSDCPKTNSFNQVIECVNSTCTATPITYIGIGDECHTSSTTSRCASGLTCSGFGLEDGVTACQTIRSYGCDCSDNAECDGGLCLNSTCDALRAIGDPCTSDGHCGSVCVNGKCATGPVGAKCNAHHSCASGYCNTDTCETDTRPACGPGTPNFASRCADLNAICYDGVCYARNGGLGAPCNNTVPGLHCKVSLACVNGACNTVAEGTACSSPNDCTTLQSCVCGSGSSSNQYGCYTTLGTQCATTYQALDDCLSKCTEIDAEGIPNTCAFNCSSQRAAYECCIGCANNSPIINYIGTCPNIQPINCCSSNSACGVTRCGNTTTPTGQPTSTPTQPPTEGATPPPSEPGTSGGVSSFSLLGLVTLLGCLSLFIS